MNPAWSLLHRSQRDAAYANRAAVPDAQAYLAAQAERSAEIRRRRGTALDVAYGSHERERIDIFAAADPHAPCLVFVHGGYWQMGSREANAVIAAGPLDAGWSVALVGYPLTPEVTLTTMVERLHAALDVLAADGPTRGIAGPLIVAGHSAGAHLAALLLDHTTVIAALAVSGLFELGPIRDTGLNAALNLSDAEVETLSPLRRAVSRKPLTVAYGSAEIPALVGDSRDFHAYRAAAHAPGALLPIPGANHFDVLEAFATADAPLTRALGDLLATATAPPRSFMSPAQSATGPTPSQRGDDAAPRIYDVHDGGASASIA